MVSGTEFAWENGVRYRIRLGKWCPVPNSLGGIMRIISFIEDREVIQAILKHLGLWRVKSRPIPKAHAPPALNRSKSGQAGYVLDQFSQLPMNDDHLVLKIPLTHNFSFLYIRFTPKQVFIIIFSLLQSELLSVP